MVNEIRGHDNCEMHQNSTGGKLGFVLLALSGVNQLKSRVFAVIMLVRKLSIDIFTSTVIAIALVLSAGVRLILQIEIVGMTKHAIFLVKMSVWHVLKGSDMLAHLRAPTLSVKIDIETES